MSGRSNWEYKNEATGEDVYAHQNARSPTLGKKATDTLGDKGKLIDAIVGKMQKDKYDEDVAKNRVEYQEKAAKQRLESYRKNRK